MKKLLVLSMIAAMAGAASANYLVNGSFESSFAGANATYPTFYDGSSNSYAYVADGSLDVTLTPCPGWTGAKHWGYVWNPSGSGGINHYASYVGLTTVSEGNGAVGSWGVSGQTLIMWQNTGAQAVEGDIVTLTFDLNSLSADYALNAWMNVHLQFIGSGEDILSYNATTSPLGVSQDTWTTMTIQTVVTADRAGKDIQVHLNGAGVWIDNVKLEIQPRVEIEKVAGTDDVDVSTTFLNKNTTYVLESSTDLTSGNWTTNATGLGTGEALTLTTDSTTGSDKGFYRLQSGNISYNWTFESGTLDTWTKTGNAFDLNPASTNEPCTGYDGTYLVNSYLDDYSGGGTGVLTSATITLEPGEGLAFRMGGYSANGGAGTDFSYITLNDADTDAELDRIWAPGFQGYMAVRQLNHGQSNNNVNVYVQLHDDVAAEIYCWLAVDSFRIAPVDVTFAQNSSFEMGTLDAWTESGTAFVSQPTLNNWTALGNPAPWPSSGFNGNYLINTYYAANYGAGGIGVLSSETFNLETNEVVAFLMGGYSAEGGAGTDFCYVTLNRADNSNEIARVWAPGIAGYMATSQLEPSTALTTNTEVFVEVVDDVANAWAWLSVDNFRPVLADPTFEQNSGFEIGTVGGWTRTGNAFVSQPVATTWPSDGYDGAYLVNTFHAADFGAGGIGTLTSSTFNLATNEHVSFLMGGWSAIGAAGTDFCYVTLNDDVGNELDRVWAPGITGTMTNLTLSATTNIAVDVYLEVVDDGDNDWGWLSVDDFQVVED